MKPKINRLTFEKIGQTSF